jgi:hypothetical protein
MTLSSYPVIGTIRLEPTLAEHSVHSGCDDSSLELLLASFAHYAPLNDDSPELDKPFRLVAARRMHRLSGFGGDVVVRANLAQLMDELQAELDQLDGRLA